MKKFLIFGSFGLVIGNIVTTYFGPSFLTWWFESPVNMAVNCTEPIRWAMNKLILVQMIGTVAGLTLGMLLSFFLFKKKQNEVM